MGVHIDATAGYVLNILQSLHQGYPWKVIKGNGPFNWAWALITSTVLPYYEKMGFINRDIPDIYSPLTLTGWNLNNIFPSYDISLRRNWNSCYKVIFQRTSCQIYLYYYTLLRKDPLKWYGMLVTYQGHDKLKACGSPPGVIVADTLSFNAKIGLVDFWV